jgi:hypothetical protein
MSTHDDPRVDRATVEDLLNGRRGGPQALTVLLAAAASPAAAHELTAEPAVLAEFRAASLRPVNPSRRPSMLKTTVAKLLAAKLLTASAVATAAVGGMSVAAATGSLPAPLQDAAHSTFNAPAHGHGHGHGKPNPLPGKTDEPGSSASPSPSLKGLCTAYQAGATDNNGNAIHNPAFQALVTAAGGTSKLTAYCTKLIGPAPTHPTGKPSSHPTGKPSSHPTGKPSSHPTGAPSSHPTGAPATVPSHS